MKRWADYYDSMDPKNKNVNNHANKAHHPIDVARSAAVKYFSVYPRKSHDQSGRTTTTQTPTSNQIPRINIQPTAETSFHGERYISRSNEFGSVSNRVDAGNTNFAWVD